MKLLNATEHRLGISWRDSEKNLHRVSFFPGLNTVDDADFRAVSKHPVFGRWLKKRFVILQGAEEVLATPAKPSERRRNGIRRPKRNEQNEVTDLGLGDAQPSDEAE